MPPFVVTGASGFVGGHLVAALLARQWTPVFAISRRPPSAPSGATWLQADLLDPSQYEERLSGMPVVFHLAATTGKADPAEYHRNNVRATGALVTACRHAGVSRLVFVSSIAAAFSDRRHYPYADSKIEAERIVRESGLRHTIVRPTAIFGPGSPVEAGLRRLANLPIIPVFGRGSALLQPIQVAQLVEVLCAIATAGPDADGTIEVGGPQVLPITAWLAQFRASANPQRRPRFVHLPLEPTRRVLATLEPVFRPVLPLTAGQLATFANDGTARPHPLVSSVLTQRAGE